MRLFVASFVLFGLLTASNLIAQEAKTVAPVEESDGVDDVLAPYVEAATKKWAKEIDKFDAINASEKDPADAIMFIGSSSCLLYTSPSPRDATLSRMPSSA